MQVEHVERPINNFVQVFISPHSNYWQVVAILDLCSEGTWMSTSPQNTAKGIACETRSEPPPSPASLAVESTPRANGTCLLTLLNVRNATSPCLRFLLYEQ